MLPDSFALRQHLHAKHGLGWDEAAERIASAYPSTAPDFEQGGRRRQAPSVSLARSVVATKAKPEPPAAVKEEEPEPRQDAAPSQAGAPPPAPAAAGIGGPADPEPARLVVLQQLLQVAGQLLQTPQPR